MTPGPHNFARLGDSLTPLLRSGTAPTGAPQRSRETATCQRPGLAPGGTGRGGVHRRGRRGARELRTAGIVPGLALWRRVPLGRWHHSPDLCFLVCSAERLWWNNGKAATGEGRREAGGPGRGFAVRPGPRRPEGAGENGEHRAQRRPGAQRADPLTLTQSRGAGVGAGRWRAAPAGAGRGAPSWDSPGPGKAGSTGGTLATGDAGHRGGVPAAHCPPCVCGIRALHGAGGSRAPGAGHRAVTPPLPARPAEQKETDPGKGAVGVRSGQTVRLRPREQCG